MTTTIDRAENIISTVVSEPPREAREAPRKWMPERSGQDPVHSIVEQKYRPELQLRSTRPDGKLPDLGACEGYVLTAIEERLRGTKSVLMGGGQQLSLNVLLYDLNRDTWLVDPESGAVTAIQVKSADDWLELNVRGLSTAVILDFAMTGDTPSDYRVARWFWYQEKI